MNVEDSFKEVIKAAVRPMIDEAVNKAIQELQKTEFKSDVGGIKVAEEETLLSTQMIYRHTSKQWRKDNPDRVPLPFHKAPGTKRLYFSRKELRAWMLNNE
ncbi:unnamed protein product [marine sediment metagenome]|uniref:Uncharacterized protein n=1 Tax=marine sediment metagenome TaxID=412755 RepID=X0S149_9ZZZZ